MGRATEGSQSVPQTLPERGTGPKARLGAQLEAQVGKGQESGLQTEPKETEVEGGLETEGGVPQDEPLEAEE
jgi:hypothetical protein